MRTADDIRQDFPLLRGYPDAYLDSAATAQRPQAVLDAAQDFYTRSNANPLRGFYPLSLDATERYQAARETVRAFLNAPAAEEIIFTRNTTEGLNLVAYSYALPTLRPGDELAVSILEHHSNLLPWQMAAKATGAALCYLDCEPDGTLSEETLSRGIGPRTKIVAVTHMSNVLGLVTPVAEIVRRAHAVGAVVVLDAAQSVPHMPVDVQTLGVDFLAFSGHKLMGPMGIGVLWGRRELLEAMPPFLTGGEMIDSVTREGAVFAALPQKFEAGTVNAAGAVGLAAAIGYLEGVGFPFVQAQEQALVRRAMEGLLSVPHVRILGSQRPEDHRGILTFTVDGVHPHDVSQILSDDGINVRAGHHCAQPLLNHLGVRSATRASFYFYNTAHEADRLVESVASVRERMGL